MAAFGAMRLVMTLLVRDEADVVRENLDFHFSQGVDFAIVMDNGSRDGTRELLRPYEREGRIRVIDQEGLYDQAPWYTQMARLAVSEEAADWVLPNDADEFFCPADRSIREVLEGVSPGTSALICPRVNFVPTPEDGRAWWERMVLRERVPVDKAGRALRPKLIHRAHPELTIPKGNHRREEPVDGEVTQTDAIRVLHFQMRGWKQFERGVILRGGTLRGATGYKQRFNLNRRREYRIWRRGGLRDYYSARLKDEADHEVVEDTAFRDLLRELYPDGPLEPTGKAAAGRLRRGRARLAAAPTMAVGRLRRARRPAEVRPPAIFVVGVPRSGTTLLRLMLDAHPQVAIPAETHFLPRVIKTWKRLEREGEPREARVRACVELMTSHRRWPELEVDAAALEAHLAGIRAPELADVARSVHVVHAAQLSKPRWGDKTPGYLTRMRAIARAVPEARFVHVVRDGRDVALSLSAAAWGPDEVGDAARLWERRIRTARRQARRLPARYTEVRFEELVEDPESVLRRVAGFAALEWDDAMLAHHERAEERLAASTRERVTAVGDVLTSEERGRQHALAAQPPRGDRVGRWRSQLTSRDLEAFEGPAGRLLDELGYAEDGAPGR